MVGRGEPAAGGIGTLTELAAAPVEIAGSGSPGSAAELEEVVGVGVIV